MNDICKVNNYNYEIADPKIVVEKTMEGTYNMSGLPTPPAGYGKKLGFEPQVPNSKVLK
jgi:hypothetical protein